MDVSHAIELVIDGAEAWDWISDYARKIFAEPVRGFGDYIGSEKPGNSEGERQ